MVGLLHGLLVGVEDSGTASEGGDQHEEGGAGQRSQAASTFSR